MDIWIGPPFRVATYVRGRMEVDLLYPRNAMCCCAMPHSLLPLTRDSTEDIHDVSKHGEVDVILCHKH